jgi:hypothetical protein
MQLGPTLVIFAVAGEEENFRSSPKIIRDDLSLTNFFSPLLTFRVEGENR